MTDANAKKDLPAPPAVIGEAQAWTKLAARKTDASGLSARMKTWHRAAIWTALAGGALAGAAAGVVLLAEGGAVAVGETQATAPLPDWTRPAALLIEGLGLAASAAGGSIIARGRVTRRWIEARKEAEALRIKQARRALQLGKEADDAAWQWAVAYLLDGYLAGQIRHHRDKSRAAATDDLRLDLGLALGAGAVALVAALAVLFSPEFTWVFAFFGILAPVVARAFGTWDQSVRGAEKEARNAAVANALIALQEEAGQTWRKSTSAESAAAVEAFAERVFTVIETDVSAFEAAEHSAREKIAKGTDDAEETGDGKHGG